MSDDMYSIDVEAWINRVAADPVARRQRQAMEIVLHSIARLLPKYRLYLKGGLLMGLVHDSPRQTTDIDLTAGFDAEPGIDERIAAELGATFRPVAAELGYPTLTVNIHSIRPLPRGRFDTARFPAINIKIVHTVRITNENRHPLYFDIDISFNEPLQQVQILRIADDRELHAYALVDLIAEKYRAVLQQIPRRRERRQDIYDLHYLTAGNEIDDSGKCQVLKALQVKCRSRDIEPIQTSLADPEIRRRSEARWDSLELELGQVPAFETCYEQAKAFYESLPWGK